MHSMVRAPEREVQVGDGVAWLRDATLDEHDAIVTSMPDHSEVPHLGLDGWKAWFIEVARLCCERVDASSVALFYQTDVKHEGAWIDKAYLVQRGAEAAGSTCLFHKIVCRVPPGHATFGRPAFAHLLAFSRLRRLDPGRATADVIPDPGAMRWARAMPDHACHLAIAFLRRETPCRRVIDPFCGHGSLLAAANEGGLDALGIELSPKRARKARTAQWPATG